MIFSRPQGASTHEQDVGGVDLQELLLRMFTTARRHRGDSSFNYLEQRLQHALAGHIAGNRWIFCLAADLVDFVNVDDATLGPVVGRL
jgi:hypothetical protein